MIKMQIKMDERKIKLEGRYSLEKIRTILDNYLVNTLYLSKAQDGFYLSAESNDDFGNFGLAMTTLGKKSWFMENVDTWLYFNSEDSDDPNDFVVEDFKEFCRTHYQLTA